MKKQNLFKSALLLCALIVGSGSAWAVDVKVGGVVFAASSTYKSSNYNGTEWEYDGWTLTYAANNGGSWAHVRCGGKSSVSPAASTIVSPQITKPITKVTISNEGINGNKAGYEISSISLEAFSDEELTNKTSTTTLSGGTLPTYGTTSSPSSFDITPAATIAANSYIRISISWSTTNSKNGGLDITQIDLYNTVTSTPATFGATKTMLSFSNADYALDLTTANLPSGLAAYKVTEATNSAVTLTAVNSTVAAGTGVILTGTAGESYNIPVVATGTDISASNLLVASDGTSNVTDAYVLSSGKFHPVQAAGIVIPAGKAYLPAGSITSSHALDIEFADGETTGIQSLESQKNLLEGAFYNLAGQRVAQPTKGLYIVNGKKVIIK